MTISPTISWVRYIECTKFLFCVVKNKVLTGQIRGVIINVIHFMKREAVENKSLESL